MTPMQATTSATQERAIELGLLDELRADRRAAAFAMA